VRGYPLPQINREKMTLGFKLKPLDPFDGSKSTSRSYALIITEGGRQPNTVVIDEDDVFLLRKLLFLPKIEQRRLDSDIVDYPFITWPKKLVGKEIYSMKQLRGYKKREDINRED
jgi:hypothetical protein